MTLTYDDFTRKTITNKHGKIPKKFHIKTIPRGTILWNYSVFNEQIVKDFNKNNALSQFTFKSNDDESIMHGYNLYIANILRSLCLNNITYNPGDWLFTICITKESCSNKYYFSTPATSLLLMDRLNLAKPVMVTKDLHLLYSKSGDPENGRKDSDLKPENTLHRLHYRDLNKDSAKEEWENKKVNLTFRCDYIHDKDKMCEWSGSPHDTCLDNSIKNEYDLNGVYCINPHDSIETYDKNGTVMDETTNTGRFNKKKLIIERFKSIIDQIKEEQTGSDIDNKDKLLKLLYMNLFNLDTDKFDDHNVAFGYPEIILDPYLNNNDEKKTLYDVINDIKDGTGTVFSDINKHNNKITIKLTYYQLKTLYNTYIKQFNTVCPLGIITQSYVHDFKKNKLWLSDPKDKSRILEAFQDEAPNVLQEGSATPLRNIFKKVLDEKRGSVYEFPFTRDNISEKNEKNPDDVRKINNKMRLRLNLNTIGFIESCLDNIYYSFLHNIIIYNTNNTNNTDRLLTNCKLKDGTKNKVDLNLTTFCNKLTNVDSYKKTLNQIILQDIANYKTCEELDTNNLNVIYEYDNKKIITSPFYKINYYIKDKGLLYLNNLLNILNTEDNNPHITEIIEFLTINGWDRDKLKYYNEIIIEEIEDIIEESDQTKLSCQFFGGNDNKLFITNIFIIILFIMIIIIIILLFLKIILLNSCNKSKLFMFF